MSDSTAPVIWAITATCQSAAVVIWAITATCLLVLAFAGVGVVVSIGLRTRASSDWGTFAALGMASLCVIGGVLNAFSAVSGLTLWLALALGWLGVVTHWYRSRGGPRPSVAACVATVRQHPWRLGLISFAAVVVLLSLAVAAGRPFNEHDDFHAYLVFPIKMLQTGSIGGDPFNHRGSVLLGAQSFLDALALRILPLRQLNCLDSGAGWLVFLILVLGHLRRLKVETRLCVVILLVCLAAPLPTVNLTSVATGMALFYALMRTLANEPAAGWQTVVCQGLYVAGLMSLKTTFAPACIVLLAAGLVVTGPRSWVEGLRRSFLVLLLASLLLLPWVAILHQSIGLQALPWLGATSGVSTTVALELGRPLTSLTTGDLWALLTRWFDKPVWLGAVALCVGLVITHRWRYLRFAVAAFAGTQAIHVFYLFMSPDDRYAFPFCFAAMVFLVAESVGRLSAAEAGSVPGRITIQPCLAIGALAFGVGGLIHAEGMRWAGDRLWAIVRSGSQGQYLRDASLQAAQDSIPRGATLLACLSRPFQLDYSRNRVFVIDHAGAISPSPGMPIQGTAENLATYLRKVDIRYLAYSYADEANYGRSAVSDRLGMKGSHYANVIRRIAEMNVAFRDHLGELRRRYEVCYDDGRVWVLDLARPRGGRP